MAESLSPDPRTRIFMPPLPRLSGGMAVLAHVAEHLFEAGVDVALVRREPGPPYPLRLPVPILEWNALHLAPEDVWLIPEGWPAALLPGLQAGARCVLYVQNWAYLLGTMSGDDLEWSRLPVSFLAVSDPVAWFMEQIIGRKPEILRPGIDLTRFFPGPKRIGDTLRIAWMPRKNKALARQIRCLCEARRKLPFAHVEWLEIHDLPPEGVAERLRSAHIFLATGFPEGFALPPLEALACGCVPVGFSGLGGWDYMRQLADFPGCCTPWWPLRDTTFAGNGFYAADADVPAAAMALEAAARVVKDNGPLLSRQQEAAQRTASCYSLEVQSARIRELWTAPPF